ncbi:tripartite tricarboxylate transporter substrate binding protein [Hoeflea sp. TYP-13]|uniref:tripartite tricarboxylate transporter substrate binding protein n=1 Tax=Hoeflea sp. TYP-13 TaxID=3230023 RepID=UPI0034C6292B
MAKNWEDSMKYLTLFNKLFFTATVCLSLITGMAAADDYPTKPVEMIIGFKPGGFSDAMARKLSEPLTEALGQTIVHTYKGGAGGSIAATAVAGQPADGYTLVVATSLTFAFNPLQGKVTYTKDDFDYLLTMARFETAFVSLASKPWTDFPSMIEYAKSTGKPLRYGTLGPADRTQMEAVAAATGVTFIPLPIKGGANMMQSILGDHVDFGISGGPHIQYVKSGEMIVLAASGSDPLNSTPDTPTMTSLGFPAVSYNSVIAAPKGLPDDVKAKLEAALIKSAIDPRFQDLVQQRFVGITPMGTEETSASIDTISDEMKAILAAKGN